MRSLHLSPVSATRRVIVKSLLSRRPASICRRSPIRRVTVKSLLNRRRFLGNCLLWFHVGYTLGLPRAECGCGRTVSERFFEIAAPAGSPLPHFNTMPPKRSFDVAFKISVVEYAREHSGEQAARQFGVDPKRVRDWRKQYESLKALKDEKGGQSKRIPGGGAKKVSDELEEAVLSWIVEQRHHSVRVSRRMIRRKAKHIFDQAIGSESKRKESFVASAGWLDKFMTRNSLSTKRRMSETQKDPDSLGNKVVNFVTFLSHYRETNNIKDCNIIAMDETPVWFDLPENSAAEPAGSRSVSIKTSGHEKDHFTVILSAKADGTKLKPFIVFRRGTGEVSRLQDIQGAVITSSQNGWMNDELICTYLQKICGQSCPEKRLLVWDAYRCHISENTKKELRKYNMDSAVIPGGCTKYIQAPDVVWNQPFQDRLRALYDKWMSGHDDKEYPASGNLKVRSRRLMVSWILAAWDGLPTEMIQNSFKQCAVTNATDGSEDHLIYCFKEDQPCSAWRAALREERRRRPDEGGMTPEEAEDVEELEENEAIVSTSDSEDDGDTC